MNLNKSFIFKIITVSLIFISFFLGYYLRENSSGGGKEFYNLSWPIIQSFKKDFLYTIQNYGSFGDATIPFSHIINAYINPFNNIDTNFQLSTTIISFLIFLSFVIVLKKKFTKIYYVDIFLTSSIILLLPFYRTSAFWGKNENYGWLFLILAFYFFNEIKNNINKNPTNKDLSNIIFFCATSACALYARQALVFLPVSYLLYLFLFNANKKIITVSIITFIIFAIPGLLLFWQWGSFYDAQNLSSNQFFGNWFSYKYIIKNIPIILSFITFYLLPILFIELINLGFKKFYNKYFKSFIFTFIFFIILSQINLLNYLGEYTVGGGAVLKINYLIKKNNFLLLLLFSSFGASICINLLKEDIKNNLIILLPLFIIYGFPNILYQEYVEPLILIIFFLGLNTKMLKCFFDNITLSNIILILYFSAYLIGSIYFKHFMFFNYDEWKIFLN